MHALPEHMIQDVERVIPWASSYGKACDSGILLGTMVVVQLLLRLMGYTRHLPSPLLQEATMAWNRQT